MQFLPRRFSPFLRVGARELGPYDRLGRFRKIFGIKAHPRATGILPFKVFILKPKKPNRLLGILEPLSKYRWVYHKDNEQMMDWLSVQADSVEESNELEGLPYNV